MGDGWLSLHRLNDSRDHYDFAIGFCGMGAYSFFTKHRLYIHSKADGERQAVSPFFPSLTSGIILDYIIGERTNLAFSAGYHVFSWQSP